MPLVRQGKTVTLALTKDLTRDIKRGHAWVFADALERLPKAASGTVGILQDRRGERIASGIYDPSHAIPLRICRTTPPLTIDDSWFESRIATAYQLRRNYFGETTTGFRLLAGEGDWTPGIVIDIYDRTAVIKLDGGAPENFYLTNGIADWLVQSLSIETVVLRSRQRGVSGKVIAGRSVDKPIQFLENGMRFTADVIEGQKTGFFLDQRSNRELVKNLSHGKSVLNLFSFNGGFSIAAGLGQAANVISVDIAKPAIEAANLHWEINQLPLSQHTGVAADVFEFLEDASQRKQRWDLVICDPPSFAPSEQTKASALTAYSRLAQVSAKVTGAGGMLALASCSSHINREEFLNCNTEALGRGRRKAILLADNSLPIDHPTPLAMPELRYLKFLLFQLD